MSNMVMTLCAKCGRPFEARSHEVRKGKGRFCSRACNIDSQRKTLGEKFWSRVSKSDGCWLWTGAVFQESGYGQLTLRSNGKPTPRGAHRVAWEIHNGPITGGLQVLHRCDNKLCVRPDHLFLGTHRDNMADMKRKGRAASGDRNAARLYPERVARGDRHSSRTHPESVPRGERAGRAKLTTALVMDIREKYASGAMTVSQLSRDYGVSRTLIRNIGERRIWKHLQ